jgi:hypothetical protein
MTLYGAWTLHAGYLRLQTNTGCIILIAFPLQQWLHERASMLRCTHNAYVVGACVHGQLSFKS